MASTFEKYIAGDDGATDDPLSTQNYAMTFTIGTVGDNLTFNVSSIDIRLAFSGADSGTLSVGIYPTLPDGLPDTESAAISTGSIVTNESGATTGWYHASMSTGTLKANGVYALILNKNAALALVKPRIDGGGGYAGGKGYQSTDITLNSNWIDLSSFAAGDLLFQINGGDYAGTLCTLADARNKAGANVNSAAANESLMSDFVKQAEGRINATTRFNWVNAYSGLSEDVKYILNDCASNLAAIYAITYDMSGFTDRVEAETMINVYRDATLAELAMLKSKQVKTFITGDT